MFGFGDKRAAAVDEAERYIRAMFTGLGGVEGEHLPQAAFADPYVAGFLQVLTVHSVAVFHLTRMPDQTAIVAVMAEALDRIAPGFGAAAAKGLAESSDPGHALHAQYSNGRHDGSEHIRTLMATDDIARDKPHRAFRDYVSRHYL